MTADDQNETQITKERKTPREAAMEAAKQLKAIGDGLPEECTTLYEEAYYIYQIELERLNGGEITSFERGELKKNVKALKTALINAESFNVALFGGALFFEEFTKPEGISRGDASKSWRLVHAAIQNHQVITKREWEDSYDKQAGDRRVPSIAIPKHVLFQTAISEMFNKKYVADLVMNNSAADVYGALEDALAPLQEVKIAKNKTASVLLNKDSHMQDVPRLFARCLAGNEVRENDWPQVKQFHADLKKIGGNKLAEFAWGEGGGGGAVGDEDSPVRTIRGVKHAEKFKPERQGGVEF
jgi:hypothetical protein